MIIRKVKLNPFGGFSNHSYEMEPGLNVVLGFNEAGKTTLVNAIHAALFIPPSVKKSSQDWKNIISRYLPYPQGDTARVVLEFACSKEDNSYELYCSWGAEKEFRLILNQGGEVSDESSVRKKLGELLKHGRGTYEGVLMARQAQLVGTLDTIKEDQEALNTLADVLRAVVFHSGGISVDELEDRLLEKKKKLENNWEFHNGTPKGNRHINNPHRQNVGEILGQHYHVQRLERKLKEAQKADEDYESAVKQLQDVEVEYNQVNNKEQEMKKIEKDANRRSALESKLEACNLKQEQLKKTTQEWPRKEERINYLAEDKQKLQESKDKLEKELKAAQKEQELKKKREIYKRSRELKEELDEKKEEYAKLPQVTWKKLQEIEQKEKKLSGLKAEIEGMKLQIKLVTEKALEVKVISGLQEEEFRQVEGESIFEAEGRFDLEAPNWSIHVQSGEKNVEALVQKAEQLEGELIEELKKMELSEMDEARKVCRKAADLEGEIRTLDARFKDALREHSFQELEEELKKSDEEKYVRDTGEIREEIAKKDFQIKDLDREINELKKQLDDWREKYGDYDSVLEAVIETKSEDRRIRKELSELAPLPEEYADAESFLSELQKLSERKEVLWEKLLICREEKIRAEGNMPEESPEEIEEALLRARKELQDLKSQASALRVVEKEFYDLKMELDAETFQPLQELFRYYLYPLTGYRYGYAHMEGALPQGIALEDNAEPLPLELLSHGTISGVALAFRLAMAHYLLQESKGFIIMDDPMVDLDPERKKQAAQVLAEAAQDKQIIVTTFEPDTAKLLGGRILKI